MSPDVGPEQGDLRARDKRAHFRLPMTRDETPPSPPLLRADPHTQRRENAYVSLPALGFGCLLGTTSDVLRRLRLHMCVLAASAVLFVGCDEEKPYTPFQVATSLPGAPPAPVSTSNSSLTPENKQRDLVSRKPSKPTGRWNEFGRTLKAPEGTVFYVGTLDPADESDSVIAWALPKQKSDPSKRSSAGLYRFDVSGSPKEKILPVPDFLPQGEDCTFKASLQITGPSSLTSDLSVECSSRFLPGTPERSVAVLMTGKDQRTLLHFRILQQAPGETLNLEVDSKDADGDGSDDIKIVVTLRSPSGVEQSLPLDFLSRPGGASREMNEPAQTLSKQTARLLIASVRKAERKDALGKIDALRRLLGALCEESAIPKLLSADGEPLTCEGTSKAAFELTQAALQCHLGEGEPALALGELGRVDWYFGTKTATQKTELQKKLLSSLQNREAKKLARFEIQVAGTSSMPFASPLVFSPDGQLWARTQEGKTKRLTRSGDPPLHVEDPEGTEEGPVTEPVLPDIALYPEGPHHGTLSAALPSCDRSEIQLVFTDTTGARAEPLAPITLPILAPRPGICRTLRPMDLELTPLRREAGQIVFALAASLLRSDGTFKGAPPPFAWSTPLGIALGNQKQLSLLTGPHVKGLHHCVANHQATEIACLGPSGVTVLGIGEAEGH